MKPQQLERILRHLAEWSRHAFEEFSADELARAAADAERDGDYAAAARLHNRASAKRQAESALR
jgi:hypothetical protein